MEIFYLGRWRTIETLRTNSHGRFTYRYTFGTGRAASYLFRASIQYSHAYPFLASDKSACASEGPLAPCFTSRVRGPSNRGSRPRSAL